MSKKDALDLSTPIFITGIGTDVGKTVVSAILCDWLQANYWKPIQSGDPEGGDSKTYPLKYYLYLMVYPLNLGIYFVLF